MSPLRQRPRLLPHRRPAFTLTELLIVIGILGVLAAVVLQYLNVAGTFRAVRDVGRRNDVRQLANGLQQYLIDQDTLPAFLPQPLPSSSGTALPVCKRRITADPSCGDLSALVPGYLADIPVDSLEPCTNYSGYRVFAADRRVQVVAPLLGEPHSAVCTQPSEGQPQQEATAATNGEATNVTLDGNNAYVLDSGGVAIFDVSVPTNPALRGRANCSGSAPGGGDVSLYNSVMYVPCGYGGIQMFNVANVASPQYLGTVGTAYYALGTLVHQGKLYLIGHYTGVAVYDLTNPAAPTLLTSFWTGHYALDAVAAGHYLYVASFRAGLKIYDVANPAAPVLVATGAGAGFNSHGITVVGRYAYDADVSRVLIYDVTDPTHPTLASTIPAGSPLPSYFIQGAVSGRYLHATGGPGGIFTWDVSDPTAPVAVGQSVTDSAGTYRWGVAVRGDYAYVPDTSAGLQVFDLFPD